MRALQSLISLLFIYSNIIIILAMPFALKKSPLPQFLDHFFNVYGVFSYYNLEAKDLFIWVLPGGSADTDEGWVPLDLNEYFPYKRGAYAGRMFPLYFIFRAAEKGDDSIIHDALERVSQKILSKYNRIHPDKPAYEVKMAFGYWPKSRKSYGEYKKPGSIKFVEIYRGPKS